jgi:Tfp pilus assembly protein PilV
MYRKLTRLFLAGPKRAGLTLSEVVVASTLLILAIVPILKGLTTSHLDSSSIAQRFKSVNLAKAKLDEIRAESIYSYGTAFAASNVSLGGAYLCNISDPNYGADLRTITVDVGYDTDEDGSLAGSEVLTSLSSMIANRWQ